MNYISLLQRGTHGHTAEHNPNILEERMPETATNPDVVDSIIAKQMMELSVEDREKVYMDVHAVKEGNPENEEVIQDGLQALGEEIGKLQDKSAYDHARSVDSKYVDNDNFRLAFLRADGFDPKKAALRIVRHFQVKLDLFGKDKLAMDILQDDLDRDAMELLYTGKGQFLDARDRAGRLINVIVHGETFSTKAFLQRGFYNVMAAVRNVDAHVHGMVVVMYMFSNPGFQCNIRTIWNMARLTDAFPIRIEAFHFCHDSLLRQVIGAVLKTAVGPFIKIRTRTHCGTRGEVMSSLVGYGIELGVLPIAEDSEITNLQSYHQRLIELRSAERRTHPRRSKIYLPSQFDVLFGKGTPFQNHSGNKHLRALVFEWHKMYEKAEKGQKMQISQEIVNTIERRSGLFLRPDGDSWVCVEDDAARQKVSAAFRTLRKLGDREK